MWIFPQASVYVAVHLFTDNRLIYNTYKMYAYVYLFSLELSNLPYYDNNNSDFFCANILEDQAQWRDKTKGLSKLIIVKQCMSHQWMDEEARRLRRIASIRDVFRRWRNETILPSDLTLAGSEFHTV